jgi:thiol-disulfide isomerase/thioredoxin
MLKVRAMTMNKKNILVGSLLVFSLISILFIVLSKDPDTPKKAAAQDFSLENLNGELVSLSDFRGDRVYIKFWASWCSICLSGLEELNTLSADVTDYKVLTIVSPGYKGEMEKQRIPPTMKSSMKIRAMQKQST